MKIEIILYLLLAFFLSYKFASGTKNYMFFFLLFLWIMAEPTLNARYFHFSSNILPFSLNVKKIYLCLLVIPIIGEMLRIKKGASNNSVFPIEHNYECWIYVYIIVILISTSVNKVNGLITVSEFLVVNAGNWLFIVFYNGTKIFIDPVATRRIFNLILVTSVISAVFAIGQVFIDPEFFKIGYARLAFEETVRAHGIFGAEYTMSFFHITAIILIITYFEKYYILILPNLIAIALSFHRLSYAIFILIMILILISTKKKRRMLFPLVIASSLFLLSAMYLFESYGFSVVNFVHERFPERVSAQNIFDRFDQYKNAYIIIQDNFWGIGSYMSNIYISYADKIGQVVYRGIYNPDLKIFTDMKLQGVAIHNGFLSAGVLYGILGLISFFMMCASTLFFFIKKFRKPWSRPMSMAPLLVVITWILYQTTNGFNCLYTYYGIYFGIILAALSKMETAYPYKTRETSKS